MSGAEDLNMIVIPEGTPEEVRALLYTITCRIINAREQAIVMEWTAEFLRRLDVSLYRQSLAAHSVPTMALADNPEFMKLVFKIRSRASLEANYRAKLAEAVQLLSSVPS